MSFFLRFNFSDDGGLTSTSPNSTPGTSGTISVCPASFGGAVVVAGRSVVQIDNSKFEQNSASCWMEWSFCTANGGAIAIVGSNKISARNVLLARNRVECDRTSRCQFAAGGCFFANNGHLWILNSTLENNFVTGVSGGGAVALDGSAMLSIFSTEVNSNSASQGGGILVKGGSTLELAHSVIKNNFGSVTAGAVAAYEEANLNIRDTVFVNNLALRVPGIFGFEHFSHSPFFP